MQVTLDLDRLLAEGRISAEEYTRLAALAGAGGRRFAVDLLLGFGICAVVAGLLALLPTAATALGLGSLLLTAALLVRRREVAGVGLATATALIVGVLVAGGGVLALTGTSGPALAAVAVATALVAALAGSSLLASLAVLTLASALGARTAYWHASYFLGIETPAATAILFSALALALHRISTRLPPTAAGPVVAAARTAVLVVNLALWVGSLWGDAPEAAGAGIPPIAFTVVWALALVGAAAWGAASNRRWLVNVAAVFGGIHFYTQWFEHLGTTPASVLAAGVGIVVMALLLARFNRRGTA